MENNIFENSDNPSKQHSRASNNDPIPIATTIVAGSGSESVIAGSGSVYSSPATDTQAEKQKSYAFSRQFSQRGKKVKSGGESSLDKMISMIGMPMQQDFEKCQDKMKNERELCRQELAMQ